jgi:alkylation response protein AidB-like acyl-CoA dehydrogenase
MVNFDLTEDQIKFIELAREFADKEIRPVETELDRLEDPEAPFKSPKFWDVLKKANEIGFNKMAFPEYLGGLGMDNATMLLVFEELFRGGAGIATSIYIAQSAALLTLMSGNNELIEKYTVPFIEDKDAKLIGALPIVEPDFGSDAFNYEDKNLRFKTTAVLDGDEWVINGAKAAFVSNGGIATHYVVTASVYPEHGVAGSAGFLVPADLPGVSKGKALNKLGMRCLNQCEVYFDNVRIPENHMIMEADPSTARFREESFLCLGNTSVSVTALGIMRAAYEETLKYSKQRIQGGKPLFEHPTIKLKLFDARASIEASRALLTKINWYNGTKFPGDIVLSISGRWYVCNQAMRVATEMVQIMGGYGLSKDFPVEKFFRDAKMTQIEDGALDSVALFAARHL